METVEIQERYTKKAVRAVKQEESELALYLKAMGEKLEALMGEIKDMECHSCYQKGHFARECPTCGIGNAGTTHRHAGKGDRSYSQSRRNSDD